MHTQSQPNGGGEQSDLHNPRILCLHGGGVTGEIFRSQARALIPLLKPYFRFVFADGPYLSGAGPGIKPIYEGWGPYRRWLRWIAKRDPKLPKQDIREAVENSMRTAMEEDDALGATGEWVGIMGFSQGATVSASVLLDNQFRMDKEFEEKNSSKDDLPAGDGMVREEDEKHIPEGIAGGKWRFGIFLAARAPLASLSDLSDDKPWLLQADEIGTEFDFEKGGNPTEKLRLPAVHVHGMKDQGLPQHRKLVNEYCDPETQKVIEWDGDHKVATKQDDAQMVVDGILSAAQKAGVLNERTIKARA